ncbi:hypothetical protein SLEP1_g60223, partial [Rubroshorea leprosula]
MKLSKCSYQENPDWVLKENPDSHQFKVTIDPSEKKSREMENPENKNPIWVLREEP